MGKVRPGRAERLYSSVMNGNGEGLLNVLDAEQMTNVVECFMWSVRDKEVTDEKARVVFGIKMLCLIELGTIMDSHSAIVININAGETAKVLEYLESRVKKIMDHVEEMQKNEH